MRMLSSDAKTHEVEVLCLSVFVGENGAGGSSGYGTKK